MADEAVILVLVGVLAVVNLMAIIGMYAARYKRVRPNQAMVVYGRRFGAKGFQVYTSGGKFILPIIESCVFLSLEPFPLDLQLKDVALRSGAAGARVVHVRASGFARISPEPEHLERAASSVSGKSSEQIQALTQGVVGDHLRRMFAGPAYDPSYPGAVESIRSGAQNDLDEFGIRLVSLSMTMGPSPSD